MVGTASSGETSLGKKIRGSLDSSQSCHGRAMIGLSTRKKTVVRTKLKRALKRWNRSVLSTAASSSVPNGLIGAEPEIAGLYSICRQERLGRADTVRGIVDECLSLACILAP